MAALQVQNQQQQQQQHSQTLQKRVASANLLANKAERNSDKNNMAKSSTVKSGANIASVADKNKPSGKQASKGAAASRRYYIDELGFYRHLDPEQRQYVCSNLSSGNLLRHSVSSCSPSVVGSGIASGASRARARLSAAATVPRGDGGFENCYRAIRHDLGISHFDRTAGYEQWKRDWDNFMRSKLTKQEPVTLNNDLKRRVRSGVPHDYRCKVWTALIRMRTRHLRARYGEDIYSRILADYVSLVQVPDYSYMFDMNGQSSDSNNNSSSGSSGAPGSSSYVAPMRMRNSIDKSDAEELDDDDDDELYICDDKLKISRSLVDKCFKQIELDLLRTLPNNCHFEDPNSRGIQRVRRVLRAFVCFNQTIGYCQGMNRLAAMALLVLPEDEAFWCLVAIVQCIMPNHYYLKPWLAQVDCCVLADLLERKMPKLHKHLIRNDIQLTLFTWFFTIFVDGFRPELMLRIWDCFLLEGDKVLFRFALAILHLAHDDLLRMHEFSAMSQHLSQLASTRRLDIEHLFESKLII